MSRRLIRICVVQIHGDGTVSDWEFTCRKGSMQLYPDGRAYVRLVDGYDDRGPVVDVLLKNVDSITRRLVDLSEINDAAGGNL